MSDDYHRADQRLVENGHVPVDLLEQVDRLVSVRRRRRRATAAAGIALTVAAAAGVAFNASDLTANTRREATAATSTPDPASPTDPAGPVEPDPPALSDVPATISCAGGRPTAVDLDHPGYALLSDLLADWSGLHGDYRMDDVDHRLMFVRADGTAHAQLTFTANRDGRWFPSAFTSCPDSATAQTPLTRAPLPSLAAYDFIDCGLRTAQESVARADVMDPLSGYGSDTPAQAAAPFKLSYDLVDTYEAVEGRVIATIVGPSDGVALALSLVADRDQRWHVAGMAGCPNALPGLTPSASSSAVEALDLGHCWIEPFTFAGQSWLPPLKEQFGGGGGMPDGFVGIGTARVGDQTLQFTDVSGSPVNMIPASDPDATLANQLCD